MGVPSAAMFHAAVVPERETVAPSTRSSRWHAWLRVLAWPVFVPGTVAIFVLGMRAGIPRVPFYLLHVVICFTGTMWLERQIPFRRDWVSNPLDDRVDRLHLLLSTVSAHFARTAVALGIVALFGDQWAAWLPWAGAWSVLEGTPWALQALVAVFALDMCMYWQHRLMHEVPVLWPVHEVHHFTRTFSPLRSMRNHAVGPALTSTISAALLLSGMPVDAFLFAHAVLSAVSAFHHVNADVDLKGIDRVFVGPRAHRWHHSPVRDENNCNLGLITTLGDRLPWHRIPLLGRLMRFQHTTLLLPDAPSPPTIGTQGDLRLDRTRGAWGNWLLHQLHPFRAWRGGRGGA